MSEHLTLKNIDDGPVIVQGSTLWPGETRAVPARAALALAAQRPEALAAFDDAGARVFPAQTLAAEGPISAPSVLVGAVTVDSAALIEGVAAELVSDGTFADVPAGERVDVPAGDLPAAVEEPADGGATGGSGEPAGGGRAPRGRRAGR